MQKLKYLLLIIFFVGIDQFSKFYVHKNFESPIKILSFFQIKLVENSGIAFSFPIPQFFILIFTTLILIWLGQQIFFKKLKIINLGALILIFSGAIGNLIDRILYAKVTDFLAFWNFPIFNVADILISLGIIWFFFDEIFSK